MGFIIGGCGAHGGLLCFLCDVVEDVVGVRGGGN